MKLIVGLGNPGKQYEKTRHNVGYELIDFIADEYDLVFKSSKKFNSLYSEINFNNEKIILVKPLSYMNLSGDVVSKYIKFYNINTCDLLVFQDDLDMDLGKIRILYNSSSGGHNGIKDIERKLGTREFVRLKIGISNDRNIDTKDYVLSKFSDDENEILSKTYIKIKNILEDFAVYDVNKLKQIYNSKNNE